MTQPEELKRETPWPWSVGRGTDVWALFCACASGDLENVRRLVEKEPALVRTHFSYRKPLYFAVRENQLEVAAYLLDRDPDPIGLAVNDSLQQIAIDRGYTAMSQLLEQRLRERHGISEKGERAAALIRRRDLAGLRVLLDAFPDLLHAGDLRANQPIHWAVMTRQLEFIDELLRRGADVRARRYDGAQPIHLTYGDYHFRGWRDVPREWPTTPADVLRKLRASGADLDLAMACATADLSRVRTLLDNDPKRVNQVSDYASYYIGCGAPIKNAAARGHLEIVQFLLDRGADPNLPEEGVAPWGHALYAAVANGHHAVAKLLLEHGANPCAEVESSADVLSRALSNADRPMIELLCRYGAARPVHLLAADNDLQTAAAVFRANPALANDPAALLNAAGAGHEAFVRLMLQFQPTLPSQVRFPTWNVGAKTRELNVLLFEYGMNPSAADWLGVTALHLMAQRGDTEKAAIFLEHSADIHARDEDLCSTPLGWAAKYGKLQMVEFLLERGAKPNHPDDPPWATPLAWATRRGFNEIVNVLR